MKRMIIPFVIFILGLSLVIYSVVKGETDLYLFLIFPVFVGGGWYMLLGALLMISAFILAFIIPLHSYSQKADRDTYTRHTSTKKDTEFGGVIFIGPIPIIFGKDKKMSKTMLFVGLAIALILFVLYVLIFLNV
ncbi:MAG: DUF131 domain-containing protein [Thermoplasmata archaeon]